MKRIKVDVVSDTVCPWCYIGKQRLQKAVASLKGAEVDVEWHPFQEGRNKREFYAEKFGSRAPSIVSRMTETFAAEGLGPYNIDGLTGNTLNSHRLIKFAGRQGAEKQNALVDALFKAYFTQGKYINDRQVLLDAAKEAGVVDAEKSIDDESLDAEEVKQEIAGVRGRISGVPHFIIDGRFELSGAQDVAAFQSAFSRV